MEDGSKRHASSIASYSSDELVEPEKHACEDFRKNPTAENGLGGIAKSYVQLFSQELGVAERASKVAEIRKSGQYDIQDASELTPEQKQIREQFPWIGA
jgi:hypothetical protein